MAGRTKVRRAPVVLSIGGSVFATGDADAAYLDKLATLLSRLSREVPLLVTVGGGRTAREYIRIGRALGLTEIELDELGIDVTRLHARLLAARVGPPAPAHPPATIAAAVNEAHRVPLVILGGTEPGHTTDGVAALLAVRMRAARVVNATNVDALYDQDPRSHPKARPIERVSWERFRGIVHRGADGRAGQEFLFDRLGADTLARARIPLRIVQGRDIDNLEDALRGRAFRGTTVG
ncbi:MAG TPA: UMP kinase [Thermoplasmata archaeon]|nr:UMP kinase [Thermoplasmata archaeon]